MGPRQTKAQIPPLVALARSRRHWDNGRPARALYPKFGSTMIGQRSLELCSMNRAARPGAAHRGRAQPQSSCVLSVAAAADSDARRAGSWCTSCSSRTRARLTRAPTPPTRRTPHPPPTLRARRASSSRAHGKLLGSDEGRATRGLATGRACSLRGLTQGTRRSDASSSVARARARRAEPFAKPGHA